MKKILFLLLVCQTGLAGAVEFQRYTNSDGVTVYSNVPANCIRDSVLTCLQYHPVISAEKPAATSHSSAKPPVAKSRPRTGRPAATTARRSEPATRDTRLQLGVLEQIAEMNAIINQYYPGLPDPADAQKAREQQENILEVLQVIQKAASGEERSTIDRAIDILRSNLIE